MFLCLCRSELVESAVIICVCVCVCGEGGRVFVAQFVFGFQRGLASLRFQNLLLCLFICWGEIDLVILLLFVINLNKKDSDFGLIYL